MADKPHPKDQPQSDPEFQQKAITERGPGVKGPAPGTTTQPAPVKHDAEQGPKPVAEPKRQR